MTIEMDKPFVWPAKPESWEPWGKEERQKNEREGIDAVVDGKEKRKGAMSALREQAKGILRGKDAWERARTETVVGANKQGYKVRV